MRKNKSSSNKLNLQGQVFGKLTVLEKTDKRTNAGLVIYKCQCACGNIVEVSSNHLRTGHTKSCGCQNHAIDDLIDQRFGRLKVISFNKRSKGYTWWNCHCDCGNDVVVSSTSLKMGSTKSCGCLNDEVRSKTAKDKFGFIDGTSKSAISKNRNINKNNTSGYRGVRYDKTRKKWIAQIMFQRKNHSLGRYDTLEEAIAARKKAEDFYFGPYRNK